MHRVKDMSIEFRISATILTILILEHAFSHLEIVFIGAYFLQQRLLTSLMSPTSYAS